MKKTVRVRSIFVMAAITAVMILALGNSVFALGPPYGIVLEEENMWVVEGEYEPATYSFSRIPIYWDEDVDEPVLVIPPETKFEFYSELMVGIYLIHDVHDANAYTKLYLDTGGGNYTFNDTGAYNIYFGDIPMHVEVTWGAVPFSWLASAPAPTPTPAPQASGITVTLNGTPLSFDVPPQIVNGRTLVPLRVIFEALGATVNWNDSTKTVTAVKGGTTVSLTISSNILYKNGTGITLDVPAQLIDSRTMVPARAVAEAFGADVKWNDATRTVIITDDGSAATPSVTGGSLPKQTQLSVYVNGREETHTGTLYVSDRFGYAIYLLKDFTVNNIENEYARKDCIFPKDESSFIQNFMIFIEEVDPGTPYEEYEVFKGSGGDTDIYAKRRLTVANRTLEITISHNEDMSPEYGVQLMYAMAETICAAK